MASLTLSDRLPFLTRDSAMIAQVRAFDWANNPLGEPSDWSPELVTAASFVLESAFPAALFWGSDQITIYNDAFRPILGDKSEALGRPLRETWPEVWNEIGPIVARAFEGHATFIEDSRFEIDRYGHPETVYFTFCYSPVRLADGAVAGVIDTVVETTSAVAAREQSRFLNNELGHRLKNMMAMVQAIAAQSLRKAVDREIVAGFTDRIHALGTANDLLLQSSWTSASLGAVVERMLSLHGGDGRFSIDGPEIALGATAALSASLLLHELATNAAKHGALSVPGGRVVLDWHIEGDADDGMLVLDWKEEGGPPAAEPLTTGFGSRIINLGFAGTRDVSTRYLPSGFEAQFRAPLHQLPL